MLHSKIQNLRQGSSLDEDGDIDVGAMISNNSFDRLEKLIEDAQASGARLLCGGNRYVHPKYPSGTYFEPTLLVDVQADMEISKEELFGPVALIFRATSPQDAVNISNSSGYALGGSIFGSIKAEIDYCLQNMTTGMIAVNDFGSFDIFSPLATYYMTQLPFGGVKESGYGRFAGIEVGISDV